MFDTTISKIVNDSLDGFFTKTLKELYDKRRQSLAATKKGSRLAIDYILQTCLNTSDALYPPESSSQWKVYFASLEAGRNKVFKQLLVIYLKLDLNNYLAHKENSSRVRSKDKAELAALEKLANLPHAFDFPNSVIHLSTGLWAVDNEDTSLIVSSLSNPSIKLEKFFDSPRGIHTIIIDSLIMKNKGSMALYMSRIHRYENWDEEYDAIYAYLLISTKQLTEALKYERLFADHEKYYEILQRFFEICAEWDVLKDLNCLNLTVTEEEALNEHLVIQSSRPVTPSSTQTSTTSSKPKPKTRITQAVSDSPARNTRSARKRKVAK